MSQKIQALQEKIQEYKNIGLLEDFTKSYRGIEKEGLRVCLEGTLSKKKHPKKLGHPLTHESITTDFSEALLEIITRPYQSYDEVLNELEQIHCFVNQHIENEVIWTSSMPCLVEDENNIPIAEFGSSNVGKMKYYYRTGLSERYGRLMQSIAGIHYNFSFNEAFWRKLYQTSLNKSDSSLQEFINNSYFKIMRNFQRYSPVLIFLFGASPAICKCFVQNKSHQLQNKDNHTFYSSNSTSLRLSPLGYQSEEQKDLFVSLDNLKNYIRDLNKAINTESEKFKNIPVKKDREYIQLSKNILQIENEFYNLIRPKRKIHRSERATLALERRGVEYLEIRCFDLNPFLNLGIDKNQMQFTDLLLLLCLLEDSPEISKTEDLDIKQNVLNVSMNGLRNPVLKFNDESILLNEFLINTFEKLQIIVQKIDGESNTYLEAVKIQKEKLENHDLLPSMKLLKRILNENSSFFKTSMNLSMDNKKYLNSLKISEEKRSQFLNEVKKSYVDAKLLEEETQIDFEEYLNRYFSKN